MQGRIKLGIFNYGALVKAYLAIILFILLKPLLYESKIGMIFNINIVEKDIEDFLYKYINCFYPNIKVLKRQFRTPVGVIDILAKDLEVKDSYIVIELKIGELDSDAFCQVLRYTQYMNSEMSKNKRVFYPLLIGNSLSDSLKKLVAHYEGCFDDTFYCQYDLFNFTFDGLQLRFYNRENKNNIDSIYKKQESLIQRLNEKIEDLDIKLYMEIKKLEKPNE